MNDIEAMKLYLEALAASKQKQQGFPGSSQQPQRPSQSSAPALLNGLLRAPPAQHHPLHAPKSKEEEDVPSSSRSSVSAEDKPIPTKLHNLVLGDEEDPEDDDEEEGHHGRNSLGKKKKTKRRKSRTASLSGSAVAATHAYSTNNNAYDATTSSLARTLMNSHPQDGTTSRALTTMTETLVMVSMEGPIPTRLIHLSLPSGEHQGTDHDTSAVHPNNKALLPPPADKASRLAREERWKRMREQLHRSGVLTARGTTPGQLPAAYQPGRFDVAVLAGIHNENNNSSSHMTITNVEFQKLVFGSVPTYQAAVQLSKSPADVKKLVQAIVWTVHAQGGRFLAPIALSNSSAGSSKRTPQLWCEVSRNIAERFALRELRIARLAKARVQQQQQSSQSSTAMGGRATDLPPLGASQEAAMAALRQAAAAAASRRTSNAAAAARAAAMAFTATTTTQEQSRGLPPVQLPPSSSLTTTSSAITTSFVRRVTPTDIAVPSQAVLFDGRSSSSSPGSSYHSKTASSSATTSTTTDPLALLSEAAFRVEAIKRKPTGGDDDDGVDHHKKRRISLQ